MNSEQSGGESARPPCRCGNNPRRSCAFTLVEVLVVIALVAILAGLALPLYRAHAARACRADAAAELEKLAGGQEQFYGFHFRYASTLSTLGWPAQSASGRFRLLSDQHGPPAAGYSLLALPVHDAGCGGADAWSLRLDHTGRRQSRQGQGAWRDGWG